MRLLQPSDKIARLNKGLAACRIGMFWLLIECCVYAVWIRAMRLQLYAMAIRVHSVATLAMPRRRN